MTKRVLITGANGFTGPYVAEAFKAADYEVFEAVRSLEGSNNKNCFELDLSDIDSIVSALILARPSVIVHLAGVSFVGHGRVEDFFSVNVVGTDNLFKAVLRVAGDRPQVIVASSANVYQPPVDGKPLAEDSPIEPSNHYAISKFAMESTALLYKHDVHVTIVRPFNYIGFGQNIAFVVSKIVSAFSKAQDVIYLGTTSVRRDFTNVRDLADAYLKLAEIQSGSGEVFNVCTGIATSIDEIIAFMENIAGLTIDVRLNTEFVRDNEIDVLVGDNRKLSSLADWEPQFTIRDTLEQYYRKLISTDGC